MTPDDPRTSLRRRLEGAARQAAAHAPPPPSAAGAPRPGELWVHPATAEHPVEWLVLEPGAEAANALRVAPADTFPETGVADLRGAAGGGVLVVRCGESLEVPATLLARGRRTGAVEPTMLRRAVELAHGAARGDLPLDPLGEESEAETEYRDWIAMVVSPAAEALTRAAGEESGSSARESDPGPSAVPIRLDRTRPVRHRRGREVLPWALAAGLAVAVVGLGGWIGVLREELAREQAPRALAGLGGEVRLGGAIRGPAVLEPVPGGGPALLYLVLTDEAAGAERYRAEIVDASGRSWRVGPVAAGPGDELALLLPARLLAPGARFRIRVDALDAARSAPRPVGERQVVVRPASPDEPPSSSFPRR